MKFLPRPKHFSRAFVLFGLLATAASCSSDNDPAIATASTQFVEPTTTFAENAGEQTISLSLNNPASVDGEIVIKATAVAPSCYTTAPVADLGVIRIPISKGQSMGSFKMTPTDNTDLDGTRHVKFTITSVSQGLTPGPWNEMLVYVTDDESPADAAFEVAGMSVRENDASAAKIQIGFAHPAPADGVLVVKLQSASTYGVDFATQPEAVGGKIFLQVAKGATSAMIDLYPVNDQSFKADRNIRFQIVDATGGVVGTDESLWCTITEDDGHQISAIATIRSMYAGNPVLLQNDTYIEGIVTSIDNTLAGRVVVEDVTGALPVQFLSGETPKRGDIVLVNVGHGLLRQLQGITEVIQVPAFEKLGEDALQINKLSLTELLTSVDRMQSRTVQLTGITFSQADGVTTLRGDRVITDGEHTIIVRTGFEADFGDDVVPEGPAIVTGIFTNCDGLYVIYPQESKDVRKSGFIPVHDGSLVPRR